ncbi:hypothetical protein [uncultured Sphingomonas sp.]|uniref:hypothetical protein n=1 Tax=uncultured Sphingomonas sp. TaxID=158754 RepID=UPI0026108A99|nr:hypothetical protein [uncultured Sphingomonas sp.]
MSVLGKIEAAFTSWADLRAAFEKARSAEQAFDSGIYADAIIRAESQGEHAVFDDRLTNISDMLTDVRVDAEDAMALTPAPDVAAALYKIEYARTRWKDADGMPEDWWAAVLSDLRRFAGAEAAVSLVAAVSSPKSGELTPADWSHAEGLYRSLADVEVEGMPETIRAAVDHALCLTMNHLVEAAPAPDVDALILKMEIARDCSDAGMPSQWWDVLEADVVRLVGAKEVAA